MKRQKQKLVTMGQSEIIRWLIPDRNWTGRQIWTAGVYFYLDTFEIRVDRDWWSPQHPSKYTKHAIAQLLAKGTLIEHPLYGYALSEAYLEAHGYDMLGAKYSALDSEYIRECDHLRNHLAKLHKWNEFVYLATDKAPRYWYHDKDEFHFINWQGKLNGFPVDVQPMNTKDAIEDGVKWHERIVQGYEHELARVAYAMDTRPRTL